MSLLRGISVSTLCVVLSAQYGLSSFNRAFAQIIAPLASQRDPQAIQLLSAALQQAGGQNNWQTIHGARVKGTLTAVLKGKSGEITTTKALIWLDDWSTGRPRFSRSITNDRGVSHTAKHSDTPTFTTNFHGRTLVVRQFDSASVLLTHLPGAALSQILSNDAYSIVGTTSQNDHNHDEVTVSNADDSVIQIWYLSKQTGQVDAVRYTIPDALNSAHHVWETAIYKHYRLDQGLSVPDKVTIIRPNSLPVDLEFGSLEKNPAVLADDFIVGGGK